MRDKYKEHDDEDIMSPFQGLEKAAVLQECRAFNDDVTVKENPAKCSTLITKLLFLLVKGENFTSKEMTEVFFGVTKLFQSDDVNLRRMTYLFIKEVAETCDPDDIIIVTASLTKDMNKNDQDLYRANAMRVLAKIIDSDMLGAIERYIKQAIVDRNACDELADQPIGRRGLDDSRVHEQHSPLLGILQRTPPGRQARLRRRRRPLLLQWRVL